MLGFNEPIINRCGLCQLGKERHTLSSIASVPPSPRAPPPAPTSQAWQGHVTSLGQWNAGKVIPITFRVRKRSSSTWQVLQTLALLRQCSRQEIPDRPWTKSPWGAEPLPFLPPHLQSLCKWRVGLFVLNQWTTGEIYYCSKGLSYSD